MLVILFVGLIRIDLGGFGSILKFESNVPVYYRKVPEMIEE
jgi:hypothetical protein